MKCRNAKKLVFEFLDGLSDEKVRLELEQHLSECGECEKLASQLTRSMDLLHRAPLETPSENFNWQVRLKLNKDRNAIQERAASQGSWLRGWNLRFAASGAAAFAVIVAAGVIAYNAGMNPLEGVAPAGTAQIVAAPAEKNEGMIPADGIRSTERLAMNEDRMVMPPSSGPGRLTSFGVSSRAESRTAKTPLNRNGSAVALDLDSMVRKDLSSMERDERVRYLETCVELMKRHLDECKTKDR